MKEIDRQTIVDLSIKCVDKMVEKEIIKDCTDTNDITEFDVQDIITDVLCDYFKTQGDKMKVDELLNKSCELIHELEGSNKYFYDFYGGKAQKERVDQFFNEIREYNEAR